MSCIPADRLIQDLKTQVPGVTDDMLNIQIYNVVDEFLRKTNAWRINEEITLEEDLQTYDIALPVGAEFVRMMSVTHNNIPVAATASAASVISGTGRLPADMIFPDQDASFYPDKSDLNAGVFSYSAYTPDYISVTFLPGADGVKYPLVVTLAAALGKRCLECECGDWPIPEWMWNMYFEAWQNGVLSKFYLMPFKPWSSPKEGVLHGKKFRNKISFHKQESDRGFVYDAPTWRFPRGWV